MKIERIADGIEGIIDFSLNSLTQEMFFKRPESCGTIRVAEVFNDHEFKGFEMCILDFEGYWAEDDSAFINRLPKGFFHKDEIVEVFARKTRLNSYPQRCLVAIKPFNRVTYGQGFLWDEEKLTNLFMYNLKDNETSPRFFRKFFR